MKISEELVKQLISTQFPEYSNLEIVAVDIQGHDNRTFRLGNKMLVRLPSAKDYALKVPIEQHYLPKLKPHLSLKIPIPLNIGNPSSIFPYHFSIYEWLEGISANQTQLNSNELNNIALQLAIFLQELQNITDIKGPIPGQHNWWRGDHISVYDKNAKQQINTLKKYIDSDKALSLWDSAYHTRWQLQPIWIHGDVAIGNLILLNKKLHGVIDFGGMAMGDPACDLTIAFTWFEDEARDIFIEKMAMNNETWLRAKAWTLWKASYELCQCENINSTYAKKQINIINTVIND